MLPMLYNSLVALCIALPAITTALPHIAANTPAATVKNGTYSGIHSPQYDQDFFLGVPFAEAPINDLRFANPQSLNASWHGSRPATEYSAECVGYGPSQMGYNTSEDCLYLNVIRPSGYQKQKLPVLVWIFGGGFVQGGAPDLRYNLSFIVEHSVKIGQPVIGISINYRLSAWGFLQSKEVRASGGSNFGIRDQRLALHWIQENIAAFGGDPKSVTIWGQSAGAMSVGLHVTAYDGRNDGLFRAAIMDSGGPLFSSAESHSTQPQYNNLTRLTGCGNAHSSLQCLRGLSYEKLNTAINTTSLSGAWGPRIDDDIIFSHSSQQLSAGHFVHVPIIIGTNSDEGTSFAPTGMNTTAVLKALNASGIPAAFREEILQAYPEDTSVEILHNLPQGYELGPPYGAEYRRAATHYGDTTFIAGRRLACTTWAGAGLPVYSYRFNAIPAGYTQEQGATHFVEVAFAMMNLEGVGYEPVRRPPFQEKPESYRDLARLMNGGYVSFVSTLDPNAWRKGPAASEVAKGVPLWPTYNHQTPMNFVFDTNVTSYVEQDNWMSQGIDLINSANLAVYDR